MAAPRSSASTKASIDEGKKYLKAGHKLAKGGLFSKSNPDDAEKQYEKARKKVSDSSHSFMMISSGVHDVFDCITVQIHQTTN